MEEISERILVWPKEKLIQPTESKINTLLKEAFKEARQPVGRATIKCTQPRLTNV